jgi:flavin prenyltransferase
LRRNEEVRRLVIGITGARGARYGIGLLEILRDLPVETHLVMCDCSRASVVAETGRDPEEIRGLADRVYAPWNQAARISSGSFLTEGMIVAGCSSKSMASISLGLASNLIHRAADVVLKEGRRLALIVQEPLSPLQDGNLRRLERMGVIFVRPGLDGAGAIPDTETAMLAGLLRRFRIEYEPPGGAISFGAAARVS